MSIPRLRSIGFMPAATDLPPSRTMACASTVAVVVPSPAVSLVFEATSRSICAPMFSNLSSSSISLATVTPSLVMRGAPKLFSMTTLRPLGPSVTLTAFARTSTPRSIRSRASPENFTSLAAIDSCSSKGFWQAFGGAPPRHRRGRRGRPRQPSARRREGQVLSGDHAHDVGLLHDQELIAIQLDLGARPFAEQHAVSDLDVDRDQLAVFVPAAGADRRHFALGGLFLGGVGNDDAALGLFFGVDTPDHDAVMQRTKFGFGHDVSFFADWLFRSGCCRGRIATRPI